MSRQIFLITAVISAVGLTACNTVAGAGKDVSSVGKTVTKTADDHK